MLRPLHVSILSTITKILLLLSLWTRGKGKGQGQGQGQGARTKITQKYTKIIIGIEAETNITRKEYNQNNINVFFIIFKIYGFAKKSKVLMEVPSRSAELLIYYHYCNMIIQLFAIFVAVFTTL